MTGGELTILGLCVWGRTWQSRLARVINVRLDLVTQWKRTRVPKRRETLLLELFRAQAKENLKQVIRLSRHIESARKQRERKAAKRAAAEAARVKPNYLAQRRKAELDAYLAYCVKSRAVHIMHKRRQARLKAIGAPSLSRTFPARTVASLTTSN